MVGWVIGQTYSSVSGYILENIFYGSIFVDNKIYFVDPFRVSKDIIGVLCQQTLTYFSKCSLRRT